MKNWIYAGGIMIVGFVVAAYVVLFETEIENVYAQPTAHIDGAVPSVVERWEM